MGVRGLTSYIAQNAERYLRPHELHDCDLVIDGDNLACNLFNYSSCNSAFGGDYDEYYRTVVSFFHLLSECNIRPFVLLDGGYELKKMRTVEKRLRSKIGIVKHLNPAGSKPLFPLMMREVFIDAAKDCNVHVMRCIFEADNELAVLSRKLNCPILSYDSDFYIYNVKYIPIVTLTMRILIKNEGNKCRKVQLRKCEARNIKKRAKLDVLLHKCSNNNTQVKSKSQKTIKYLDCCMYTIENLTSGYIGKDLLPLFAALLGNDYIETKTFNKFFSHVCLSGTSTKISRQQRRIKAILRWLKYETKESAVQKILGSRKQHLRGQLMEKIEKATMGYRSEKSMAFEYFGFDEDFEAEENEDDEEALDQENSNLKEHEDAESSSEEEEEEIEEGDEEEEGEEEVEEEEEDEEEFDEEEEEFEEEEENEETVAEEESIEVEEKGLNEKIPKDLPEWFRNRVLSGEFPRFMIDLLNLNLYVNSPQIENFLYPDCNEIALPILQYIHSLLHYPEINELRYLSRVVRRTNVCYTKLTYNGKISEYEPEKTCFDAFRNVLDGLKIPVDTLFKDLELLPSNLRLYFVSIVYWSNKSEYSDVLHLHSLIICLVVLTTIDTKIVPTRNEKEFHRRYGKIIQKDRTLKAKLASGQDLETPYVKKELARLEKLQNLLKDVKMPEKINFIPKIDCMLVQENLLKYFHLPDIFRKSHNDFSSSIMHGFSEFQSVIFHLYSLNILVNYPFESIRMSQIYSGLFLYNMYVSLRNRPDIVHYVQNYVFRDSAIMFEYYKFLLDWCRKFVPCLKQDMTVAKRRRNRRKNRDRKSNNIVQSNLVEDMLSEDSQNDLIDKSVPSFNQDNVTEKERRRSSDRQSNNIVQNPFVEDMLSEDSQNDLNNKSLTSLNQDNAAGKRRRKKKNRKSSKVAQNPLAEDVLSEDIQNDLTNKFCVMKL